MIKKFLSNEYFLLIIRILLSLMFIYSGYTKIIDLHGFSDSINNYKLLPHFSVNFFAVIIPWVELITGLLLFLGISVKENAFIISVLLGLFIIIIGISMLRGLDINCGCFLTKTSAKIGIAKLIENSILIFFGIIVLLFDSKYFLLKK